MIALIFIAVVIVAYANGANDNFKGVASLYGSGTASYRKAVYWAAGATAAGSLAALAFDSGLLAAFSGKGLVPNALVSEPAFLMAVAAGSGMAVCLATWLGFPVSTTHALTGALLGAGLMADVTTVNLTRLWATFARPLLLSPVIAVVAGSLVYVTLRSLRLAPDHRTRTLDAMHFLSAGAVCFARSLNDTPKIAALLLGSQWLQGSAGGLLVAVAMTAGGLISARRVAETMAHRITDMNPGQGFAANVATALLAGSASFHGLPVSTTHLSVGSLLGIGITTGQAKWRTVIPILLAWVITLPTAALLGALVYAAGRRHF